MRFRERYEQLIGEFVDTLPPKDQTVYRAIAIYALDLGYRPKRTKSQTFTLDFTSSKVKKTLMKMISHDEGPEFRLKFYANSEYSEKFRAGIKHVIEEFGGKYTGCYGCGRCPEHPEGYTYTYSDGKKVFRCGFELIPVQGITMEDLPEIELLMATQDEYFHNAKKDISGVGD